MAPAIPDRWMEYKPVGTVIEDTRLICFKVPLRKMVQENYFKRTNQEQFEIWDIPTLLERIPNLTAVIDLTNTDRYYDPRIFEDAGVRCVKIGLPGRVIPSEAIITQFCDTVEELLRINVGGLVGVHCTHGLNRTGYMVCRYLRDRLKVPADKAIEIFEAARGYKIERENYIADIRGSIPPPPDFSNGTIVKPYERGTEKYARLSRYEDTNGYERRRYGRQRERSRSRDRSPLRGEQRRRDSKFTNRREWTPDRRRDDDDYDFRYDY